MDDHRVVANIDSGIVIFDVENKKNVLIVREHGSGGIKLPSNVLMTAIARMKTNQIMTYIMARLCTFTLDVLT